MNGQHRINTRSVTWQQVDEEVVVLDLAESRYLALNDSAAVLWNGLVEGAEAGVADDDLTDLLVRTFGIDTGRAGDDVRAFLERGMLLGLVE